MCRFPSRFFSFSVSSPSLYGLPAAKSYIFPLQKHNPANRAQVPTALLPDSCKYKIEFYTYKLSTCKNSIFFHSASVPRIFFQHYLFDSGRWGMGITDLHRSCIRIGAGEEPCRAAGPHPLPSPDGEGWFRLPLTISLIAVGGLLPHWGEAGWGEGKTVSHVMGETFTFATPVTSL